MPARLVDDCLLRKIRLHERLAIRTAVLAEVHEHALSLVRSIGYLFAEVEQRCSEPGRYVERVRRRVLRERRERCKKSGEANGSDQ
jgi:hypothetical protein